MKTVIYTEAKTIKGEFKNLYRSKEFKSLEKATEFAETLKTKSNITDIEIR